MNNWSWIPQVSVEVIAVLLVVGWFIRFLNGERKDRTAERDKFLDAITNHMQHSTEAITELKGAIQGLCFRINGRNEATTFRQKDDG